MSTSPSRKHRLVLMWSPWPHPQAKDNEISRLLLLIAPSPTPTVNPTPPPLDPPQQQLLQQTPMDEEDGEIQEPRLTTQLERIKADIIKAVSTELTSTMKDMMASRMPTPSESRRSLPKTFSENFDVNNPRQKEGPPSFAAAVRQINRREATSDHAARVVFRSSYPRSQITGITNVYMRGSVPAGNMWPQRFVIIREALSTIGIKMGVVDMSFIGKSVIHLFCDEAHAKDIQHHLQNAGYLLTDFDPLEVPELVVASGKSKSVREREGRENFVKRLGAMYYRGGQQIKNACLEGVSDDLQEAIRQHASSYAASSVLRPFPAVRNLAPSPLPKPS
ncbi:hypothetical protein BC829DRAFT_445038 [Chytridium lagenaria]|nr:hypothetical protein BC829DRAFT_445038 [Chytridium lagenaria]